MFFYFYVFFSKFTELEVSGILIVLQIVKILKFANFRNWIFLEIFGILQFWKLTNLSIFLTFVNFQIRDVWNSKILLLKILILIPKSFKFEKLANFLISYNWRIWKTIKYSKLFNVKNCGIFKNLTIWKFFFFSLPFEKLIFYNLIKLLNILQFDKIIKYFDFSKNLSKIKKKFDNFIIE